MRRRVTLSALLCLGLVAVLTPPVLGQEKQEKPEATKPEATKPESGGGDTIEIKAVPLTMVETFTARVEAKKATEIRTDMDAWTALVVESVVPQGTEVQPGDLILQFELDKIQEQIQSAEQELSVAQIGLQQALEDIEVFKKLHVLDEEIAQSTWERLQEDTNYYFDVQRKLSERAAEMRRKNSEYSVENAEEELRQLEKMYEEDELTEESEQIVLKRAQRSLEQAKFFAETTLEDVRHTLEVELPRQDENQKRGLHRGELEREKSKIAHPAELKRKELDLAKQTFAVQKQQRELAKLQGDLARMSVKAPVGGIVYHGQCKRGQWISRSGGNSRLIEVGATVPKDVVALTIVQPGDVQLRADLNEKQVATLKAGAAGIARAAATGNESLAVTVAGTDSIPLDEGKFDSTLNFVTQPAGLLPGMTAEVKIPVFRGEAVIMVPKSAVFSDDSGISNYVYVQVNDKPERRDVILGRTNGDDVEIASGLKAGEKILKKKPE